jgi:hypothetical protein
LRNWRFLGCFSSRETNRGVGQAVINSGGLILVLASGPSACPKNVRDLTVSCIHFKHHEIIKVIPNLGKKKTISHQQGLILVLQVQKARTLASNGDFATCVTLYVVLSL